MVGQVHGSLPVLGCSAHPTGWNGAFASTGGLAWFRVLGVPGAKCSSVRVVPGPEFCVLCVWDKSSVVP